MVKKKEENKEYSTIKEVVKKFFPSECRSVIVSDGKDPCVLGSHFGSEALKKIKV